MGGGERTGEGQKSKSKSKTLILKDSSIIKDSSREIWRECV